MYVMHSYKTEDDTPLRLNLGDRWFDLPSDTPVEIEGADADFMGQKLIELYGPVYGIIEIPTMKTRSGTQIDIDAAESQTRKALRAAEDFMLAQWVRVQQEERLKHNLPVLPPRGRVKQIIEERQIDLRKTYNFTPVGYAFESPNSDEALKRENAELKARLAAAESTASQNASKLDRLMAHMGVEEKDIAAPTGKDKAA